MKSAGNDIVALTAVDQQRTVSPNFYSKFIIPPERELFEQSSAMKTVSFCSFVWLLWSVKESAYKYFKRMQPELIFSPSKIVVAEIEVSDEGFFTGTLSFQNTALYYRSQITDEHIATIVNDEQTFAGVYHDVTKINKADNESQSAAVRQLALQKLQAILKLNDLSISKSDVGYPIVMQDTKLLDVALSFAHHDFFVGYSFKI